MRTITLNISDQDYERFRLNADSLTFDELVKRITAEMARNALRETQVTSQKLGLNSISMEEINEEVKAVRDAKDHS